MAYNKSRTPTNPTGCGNYNCALRNDCKRSQTHKFHHVSVFHPRRLADGRIFMRDEALKICIPFPPSVNRYWRSVNGRVLISAEGREYRRLVMQTLNEPMPFTCALRVEVHAFMPDKRRRDLDNLMKGSLDSLTHAGVWLDDSQIDDLRVTRKGVEAPGRLEIFIEAINETRNHLQNR
jgi:crossover junction endodeoxyribonuclease RusA